MDFEQYSPKAPARIFRPAGSLYGYTGPNSASNACYARAITLLTEAFGPAVVYDDWRDVVEVEGYVEKKVTKDTWYFNKSGPDSELYLTSAIQMSYLALAMKGIDINDSNAIVFA